MVTDDEFTKQWYGLYTAKQFYSIHRQISQIDPSLDDFYPDKLRPIKGLIFTYFLNDLSKAIDNNTNSACKSVSNGSENDLQDNDLCNSIENYLKRVYASLGKSLFVDILFNDLNSDHYFEVYSEFNLKRLQNQIDEIKSKLLGSSNRDQLINIRLFIINGAQSKTNSRNSAIKLTDQLFDEQLEKQIKVYLRRILEEYITEDNLIEDLRRFYAEYYNNLLKPLIDSNELAKSKLVKYENKYINQEKSNKYLNDQSAIDALNQIKQQIEDAKFEIFDYLNNIDLLYIEHKQKLIDVCVSVIDKMKNDRAKFVIPRNKTPEIIYDIMTKARLER